MTNPTPEELAAIHSERNRYASGAGLRRLFGARMAFGDTFWVGNFGVLLVVVPAGFLIALFAQMQSPTGAMAVLTLFGLAYGIYQLALLPALIRTAKTSGAHLMLRVLGVGLTLGSGASLLWRFGVALLG